jgi:hypothetical protein
LWAGHVTPKPSGPRRHVTPLCYVSSNTAALRQHVTPRNNPLTRETLKDFSQESYQHTCPPSAGDGGAQKDSLKTASVLIAVGVAA